MVSQNQLKKKNQKRNKRRCKPIAVKLVNEKLHYTSTELKHIYGVSTKISKWPKTRGGGCGYLALNALLKMEGLDEVPSTIFFEKLGKLIKARAKESEERKVDPNYNAEKEAEICKHAWPGDEKGIVVSIYALKHMLPYGWR